MHIWSIYIKRWLPKMIILYLGGYQSFLLFSSWTWVFKSAEQPNPSTRWKGELHCRRGRLLRTQPWLEPQCQSVEEEMIVKLYKNAMQFKEMQFNAMQFNLMQCNAMPSLERYLCTNLGQKKQVLLLQKNNHIGGLANILQSNWCFYQWRPINL